MMPSLDAEKRGQAERGTVVQTNGEVSEDGQWIKLLDWQGHKDCWMRWSTGPNASDMVTYTRALVVETVKISSTGSEAAKYRVTGRTHAVCVKEDKCCAVLLCTL